MSIGHEYRRRLANAAIELAMADGKLRHIREEFEKAHAAIDELHRASVEEANGDFVQKANDFFNLCKEAYDGGKVVQSVSSESQNERRIND
jgi:5-bromo-4-chloroindolyl phosphate hydrolysis protein